MLPQFEIGVLDPTMGIPDFCLGSQGGETLSEHMFSGSARMTDMSRRRQYHDCMRPCRGKGPSLSLPASPCFTALFSR